jgi:hypothetical protein
MSQEELYRWQEQVGTIWPMLGWWQRLNLAMYSLGMMRVRHHSPSRVAEGLGEVGKPESVRRRLERFLANPRLDWVTCCQAWAGWVLKQQDNAHPVLVVDETKLGARLRVMVVGLAFQSCCVPLVFWAYVRMPLSQVDLIDTLLAWIAAVCPPGCQPLVQADRGIGTSPALIQAVARRGWHYLFRVQNDTRCRTRSGRDRPLQHLVKRGEHWRGRGVVFKRAGWLPTIVLVVWEPQHAEPWCLVTNAPYVSDFAYGLRAWQEAGFRDLKSDGWQWHTSRIWTPHHAHLLLLVMSLAYAYTLSLGTLVLACPSLFRAVARPGKRQHFSLFRLGLRLFDWLHPHRLSPPRPCFLSPPRPLPLGVGV